MDRGFIVCLFALFLQVSCIWAGDIGFIEEFALAKDRTAALKQLIPGTEDYYFFQCLYYLHTEQFDQVEPITKIWHERFGQTARLTEIQTRHAFLTYDKNPEKSLAYLRHRLGLSYPHQRVIPGSVPNLPVRLDPKLLDRERLREMSFSRWSNLDNFEDAALDWLAGQALDANRRRNLLQRLARPDIVQLPRLIHEDLAWPHAQPFGTYPVSKQLTLAQLEELLTLRPGLLQETAFIHLWITKLQPGADSDWKGDPRLTRAYLDRLLTFVRRLSLAHNSLKAHVLYHRLALDRQEGKFDRDLFVEYVKLPRPMPYMAKAVLESDECRRFPVDLNADLTAVTLWPAVGNDEQLVRDYLLHFLNQAGSTRDFEPYLNDVYLRHLFAESKITQGQGDPEQWASLLPPELFRQLKDRVDIDFAATNRIRFNAEEPVALDLFVKNVNTLLVKVYEINTLSFYRTHQKEVLTDINLDGLVPNSEQTMKYSESPFQRVARRFELPQLTRPGVYVVDFIGSGKSSRAVIRKGRLRPLIQTGSAGQRVTVVDESNRPVRDARLWIGGQEIAPNTDGVLTLPFSTNPGRRAIVLSRGDFACLDFLEHRGEQYALTAGIHVDREALITRRIAALLIRPGLKLNGQMVSIKLIEEPKLTIVATNQDGIATTNEVPGFTLFEDREAIHEFRVPERLAALKITLSGKVKHLSEDKKIDLAASETFALNGIDKTEKIEDLHLAQFGGVYVLEARGRTGESRVDRAVQLSFKHRFYRELIQVALKSDAQGRIALGPLTDIEQVTAVTPEGVSRSWILPLDRHHYRRNLQALAGEKLTVPYLGRLDKPSREEFALFEVRGDVIRADHFEALAIEPGILRLRGLEAGDYDLWLKRTGERMRIRIVAGDAVAGYVLGAVRQLELPPLKPVTIASIVPEGEHLVVTVRDASKYARIHVFGDRYRPAFAPFDYLGRVQATELTGFYPTRAESVYLTGRNIGDEYRYVLDRRGLKKFPGNMLARPELLLNPWAVRDTETGQQEAAAGGDFSRQPVPAPTGAPAASTFTAEAGGIAGEFSNLDFLAESAAVLTNLVPDEAGVIRIPRKAIGPHAWIHVVAIDPLSTSVRSLSLPEQPAGVLDLRLRSGLDPKGHFTQQKQVSVISSGQTFTLADAAASRFESYDTVARVYGLYGTLLRDPRWAEFAFVTRWPNLKIEEKRALYSKYACHELNFFIANKDPEFFKGVIQPYLAHKKDKTFFDRWLLNEDLRGYLEPWQFGRLNTVERVLLAKRLPGEPERTIRYLDEMRRLQPVNVERIRELFDTAIVSGNLEIDTLSANWQITETRDRAGRVRLGMINGSSAAGSAPAPGTPALATPLSTATGGTLTEAPKGQERQAAQADKPRSDELLRKSATDGRASGSRYLEEKDGSRPAGKDTVRDEAALGDLYFLQERLGKSLQQFYRRVPPTQEWAENHYYHLPIQKQVAALVPYGPFWLDYARHDGKQPFLSKHMADAARNFTEAMLALAVIDLPFQVAKPKIEFEGARMTFTPQGPVLAFHEEVRPAKGPQGNVSVLVSQNFYRHGDRFREEGGERIDKFVTDEFVVQTVYGAQFVITNPTPSRQRLSVLIQVPVGAIPVAAGPATRSVLVDLEPYRTQTVDYLFYFPLPGKFDHFPVHVAKNEALVASVPPFTFQVVEKPSRLDTESWEYVSQNGTPEQVLAFLNRENVQAIDLEKIAFRMSDRGFFEAVTRLLRERHVYHPTLWSYALKHNQAAIAREFLMHADGLIAECAGPLVSPLLTIDPIARHLYEHLEYKPLVHPRAHMLGPKRQIVNDRFHEQYHRFMELLARKPRLDDADQLATTYYLLLQDRVADAMDFFANVKPERLATRMQYDYCAAYLELYREQPARAAAIADGYLNHPVDRWRQTFEALREMVREIEGQVGKPVEVEDQARKQGQLAASEPSFDVLIEGQEIALTWQNLESVRVNYYVMDVELLFSRNPFVQQFGEGFASIRPNQVKTIELPKGRNAMRVNLPADLARQNVLVEVTGGGKTKSVPYYANAMTLRMMENFGQLQILDAAGKPLSKVYVKVYARFEDGQVKFHKDGYTDLRGRFDYASVSTPEKTPIVRFSLLALSESQGAVIREAAPPAR